MAGQRQRSASLAIERRLSAIAFLDVVDYSKLIEIDSATTIQRWVRARRKQIDPRIAKWHGRVVDRAGDGLFVEFRSALNAIHWGLDVQQALTSSRNASPMQVRVSVHLADLIEREDGEIYGVGVNIAARLQAQGEPGCLIASKAVVDEVCGKIAASITDLGEIRLRNIARPVHAYCLRPHQHAAASRASFIKPAVLGPVRDPRPSIAVLPFRKNSVASDEAYFEDGIIDGIIHVLSGLQGLFVISRSSTLAFAGSNIDARRIGAELGVRYILYGSVYRAHDQLRISTELSDADTGTIIHSGHYRGSAAEVFELQDRISIEAVAIIAPQIRERELHRALRKHPDSMTAYDLVLQGLDCLHRLDRAALLRARDLLRQAIAADPNYAAAHSYLAWFHVFQLAQGWSSDPAADAAAAIDAATTAIERERNDA